MATSLDFIKGALRRCNAYQSGEQISPPDAHDCLETFNDLLDSWSLQKLNVYGSNENVLTWTTGKSQYKIGNPTCTSLGEPPFTGTLTSGSPTITGVTNIPSDLKMGASLSSLQNLIPSGALVTAVGATSVTMSANATGTSQGIDQITYTIPGDFAIARPLRISYGFTRISALDFPFDVYESQSEYLDILYKGLPGPWPTVAWYNNLMPYGVLSVYQTPSNNGEVHLFTDTILASLALNQTIILPQGYARALKWCLAKELCGEFGYPLTESIKTNADESLKVIQAVNARPAVRARYDRELTRGNRPDGGWIIHGGYR